MLLLAKTPDDAPPFAAPLPSRKPGSAGGARASSAPDVAAGTLAARSGRGRILPGGSTRDVGGELAEFGPSFLLVWLQYFAQIPRIWVRGDGFFGEFRLQRPSFLAKFGFNDPRFLAKMCEKNAHFQAETKVS